VEDGGSRWREKGGKRERKRARGRRSGGVRGGPGSLLRWAFTSLGQFFREKGGK